MKIFIFFLPIIAILNKSFFYFIPFFWGQRLLLYYLLFVFIVYYRKFKFSKKSLSLYFFIIFILSILQSIAYFINFLIVDKNYILNRDLTLIKSLLSLEIFLFTYFFVTLVLYKIINYYNLKYLFKGLFISLIIVLFLNYIQIFYLYLNLEILKNIIRFTSLYIESRWGSEIPGEIHRFYSSGSYVETTSRINGISEEASVNAMLIFIGFMPILLASIKNKYNIFFFKKGYLINLIIYILFSIILFLIKSSIGILLGIISFISLLIILRKRGIIFLPIIVLVFYVIYEKIDLSLFEQYIWKITNFDIASTQNRIGITVALATLFLENFFIIIFGIGRGANNFYDYWVEKNLPDWVYNFELLYFSSFHYPRPNFLLVFFNEYGFIIGFTVLIFIFKIYFNINRLIKKMKAPYEKTLADSLKYFIIYLLILSLTNFNVFYNSFFWFLVIFYFKLYFLLKGKFYEKKKKGFIYTSRFKWWRS